MLPEIHFKRFENSYSLVAEIVLYINLPSRQSILSGLKLQYYYWLNSLPLDSCPAICCRFTIELLPSFVTHSRPLMFICPFICYCFSKGRKFKQYVLLCDVKVNTTCWNSRIGKHPFRKLVEMIQEAMLPKHRVISNSSLIWLFSVAF